MTGGQVVNPPDVGLLLREVGLEVLGTARRVVVSKDSTVIVDGGGSADDIAARVKQLKSEIEASESDWDREKLQERLAKLAGGVAVIKVGAATETALKERKHRVEDAVSAAKAAVEEGIVAGGGSALVQANKALDALRAEVSGDEALGVEVFASSLSAPPLFWIATNAGFDGAVVVNKVGELPTGHGFNAATLTYGDLIADGVIDPVKVTRSAVLNAASVARMVLTTETAIVEKPVDADEHAGHGHHHGTRTSSSLRDTPPGPVGPGGVFFVVRSAMSRCRLPRSVFGAPGNARRSPTAARVGYRQGRRPR